MENYKVEQFTDDIVVFDNQQREFIKVKRRFNWKGKLTSSFIKEDICIFETTYDIFLFQKFMSIKYQNLKHTLSLSKERGVFYLNYDGNKINMQTHYFKKPAYTLHNNNLKIGEVYKEAFGITVTSEVHRTALGFPIMPTLFNIKFENNGDINFYSLLRFLMELPPTMDV